jgi:hypothetical protein
MLWVELEGEAERRQEQEVPNWRKADWAAIRNGLSRVNWDNELKDKNAEESWNHLRDTLQELQRVHIPKKSLKKDWPPWMSVELLRAIRRKRSLWKKARTAQDKEKYAQEEKKVRKATRTAKRNFEKRDCLRGQEQPQTFLQLRQEEDQGQDGCGTSETGWAGCDGRHRNGGSSERVFQQCLHQRGHQQCPGSGANAKKHQAKKYMDNNQGGKKENRQAENTELPWT